MKLQVKAQWTRVVKTHCLKLIITESFVLEP